MLAHAVGYCKPNRCGPCTELACACPRRFTRTQLRLLQPYAERAATPHAPHINSAAAARAAAVGEAAEAAKGAALPPVGCAATPLAPRLQRMTYLCVCRWTLWTYLFVRRVGHQRCVSVLSYTRCGGTDVALFIYILKLEFGYSCQRYLDAVGMKSCTQKRAEKRP